MEEIKKVNTVKIDFKCPNCEKGYLRPTGICYPMYPPKYPHKCTDCDYAETFNKMYPYVDYK